MSAQIRGLDRVLSRLQQIEGAATQALAEAAAHVKRIAATYPPQPRGRKQPFVSDRQRRFFFAALRDGRIDVPYRRGVSPGSQKLGAQWTVRLGRTSASVVNPVRYGPLVQGSRQTAFHQTTGWKNEQQISNEAAPQVRDIFTRYYRRATGR